MKRDVMAGIRTPETRVAYLEGRLDAAQHNVTALRAELKRAVAVLRIGRHILRGAKERARAARRAPGGDQGPENQP